MSNEIEIIVEEKDEFTRLDKVICEKLSDISRSAVQKLILEGNVRVNNEVKDKNYKAIKNDKITVEINEPVEIKAEPENIPLNIVYEDSDLLIVNKPKNMVVHPAVGNYTNTLVNALLYHCKGTLSGINGEIRPGIVHRIDKDTSGLLIVAKNDFAHKSLADQIKKHSFTREYEAVVYGRIKQDKGTINAPIGRSKNDRKKMAVTQYNSKAAVTHFEVIKRSEKFTHVKLKLETGRTHQIRVHMAYIGYPLAGDVLYGPKKVIKELEGQCLHARLIGFIHPRTLKYMEFSSELPEYFEKFCNSVF